MMDQGSVVEQGTHAELIGSATTAFTSNKKNYCTRQSLPINASREATSMTTNNGAAKSPPSVTPAQDKRPAPPSNPEVGTIGLVPTDLISPCSSNNLPFGHGRFSGIDGGPLL